MLELWNLILATERLKLSLASGTHRLTHVTLASAILKYMCVRSIVFKNVTWMKTRSLVRTDNSASPNLIPTWNTIQQLYYFNNVVAVTQQRTWKCSTQFHLTWPLQSHFKANITIQHVPRLFHKRYLMPELSLKHAFRLQPQNHRTVSRFYDERKRTQVQFFSLFGFLSISKKGHLSAERLLSSKESLEWRMTNMWL